MFDFIGVVVGCVGYIVDEEGVGDIGVDYEYDCVCVIMGVVELVFGLVCGMYVVVECYREVEVCGCEVVEWSVVLVEVVCEDFDFCVCIYDFWYDEVDCLWYDFWMCCL